MFSSTLACLKSLPEGVERANRDDRLRARKQTVIARRRSCIGGTSFRLLRRLSCGSLHRRGWRRRVWGSGGPPCLVLRRSRGACVGRLFRGACLPSPPPPPPTF